MRRKRCVCGFMADVDEWNAKGVVMFCPECGAFDLSRDDLYEMGLQNRMMRAFLDRWRKQWKADAEDRSIDDEEYRSACQMAVEMADEMFRGLEDADREWRDERREDGAEEDRRDRATGTARGRARTLNRCSDTSETANALQGRPRLKKRRRRSNSFQNGKSWFR